MLVMYRVCHKEYCGQYSDEYLRNVRLLSALSKVNQRVRIPVLGWVGVGLCLGNAVPQVEWGLARRQPRSS